jgi:hypothetical protein
MHQPIQERNSADERKERGVRRWLTNHLMSPHEICRKEGKRLHQNCIKGGKLKAKGGINVLIQFVAMSTLIVFNVQPANSFRHNVFVRFTKRL